MRNRGGFKGRCSGLIIFGESAFFTRARSDDGVATPTSYILLDAEKISGYFGLLSRAYYASHGDPPSGTRHGGIVQS
jgi:hypothetical protein